MIYYAVKNTKSGTIVGCYDKTKAERLRDEWNKLAFLAKNENRYVIIELMEINNE